MNQRFTKAQYNAQTFIFHLDSFKLTTIRIPNYP